MEKSALSWPLRSLRNLAFCMVMVLLLLPLTAQSAGKIPVSIAKTLRTHNIPAADVSLYVSRVSETSPSLALNEAVPRNPASVMKLLTSLLALDTLGPDYQWQTEAYIQGTLEQGVLVGDLILKGYGDPHLTPERFWQLLHGLRERGIQMIQGDLILDSSYFVATKEQRGDFDGKPWRAYNALPNPLSLNFQATQLHLLPDRTEGVVHAFTYPPLANLKISNHIKLVSGPCQKPHLRPVVHLSEHKNGATVNIQGSYSTKCSEWSNTYLVMDPAEHLGGAFSLLWKEMGGQFNGVVKQGIAPRGAKPFHSIESRPLAEVIRGMNKFSNNLMSRMLLLTVSAETQGAPATITQSQDLIADWLSSWRLSSERVRVSNGAGLARDAQISAEIIGQLLQTAFQSPIMPEFMASLPIVGIDGTMRKRLHKTALAGRAHIKTGSLNDVSSMAGYVQDRHDQRWVVTLIINHPGLRAWQGKQIQDAVLRWVYKGVERNLEGTGLITQASASACKDQLQTPAYTEQAMNRSQSDKTENQLLRTAAIEQGQSLEE
ncbi:MAG: D-alanyl-D-alanine carboxypeptidase/D-alanyl-D-alanine-endopeptidase [Candidatus Thiodiazotropha sp. (ex Lucinoma borealis)]|nr:D-alanyl-D-alanine carboxypeptidase/D-alanyl-D-alanine-endopeptidase [Candidatus Thiodiazotropha sp. (ex Lucinoma borealis)]